MATIFDRYNESVEAAIDDAVSGKAPKSLKAAPPSQAVMVVVPGKTTLSKGIAPTEDEKRKRLEGLDKMLKARGYSKGGSIDGCAQRGRTRARR